ncbi:MAG: acyltransferase family protein [Thalassotalea sp.]
MVTLALMFFILSGFVMALVSKKHLHSGVSFGINRLYRLVPIYWFYTFLLVFSILILPNGTYLTWWQDFSLLKSLLFIPNINPNGHGYYPTLYVGWTLIYELFFYLVFTAILVMRLPKPTIACALLLLVIAYFTRWHPFLGHSSLLLVEFAIGIIIFEYYKYTKLNNFFIKIFIPIATFTVFALYFIYLSRVEIAKFFIAGVTVYIFILTAFFKAVVA